MPVKNNKSSKLVRREFLSTVGITLGLSAIPGWVSASRTTTASPKDALTVQQVIDLIFAEIPGATYTDTVDTIKMGSPLQVVTGIVTTMFSTIDVLRQTAAAGANFVIAHEPTFYNHLDETTWLESDPVFQAKRALAEQHNIVVWRFHDFLHRHRPDGVLMGVLEKLRWQSYYDAENPRIITLPTSMQLREIVSHSKKSMGIHQVRIVGDPNQPCSRIALAPGAAGGRAQIQLLQKEKPDVLIVGEVNEWETAEYVRDAQALGIPLSLIVLGHAESEEPGMEWLVPWLQPKVGQIKVRHIPSQNPFTEL